MDRKTILLIESIKRCNLSKIEKQELIEILSQQKIDWDRFTKTLLSICKVGVSALKLLDIDVGDTD